MLHSLNPLTPLTKVTFPATGSWSGGEVVIQKEIGRGGAGIIYQAVHNGTTYAVKAPLTWRGSRDLMSEAKWLVYRTPDEHIGRALAITTHRYKEFVVPLLLTPLLSGGNLYSHLLASREGSLPTDRVARVMADVALALYALECVHRDLKPENIMLDAAGDAYVIDFGLAVPVDPTLRRNLGISMKSIIGTPPYLSLEQLNEDESVDQRSDIYALGLIAFELLTGVMAKPQKGGLSNHDWLLAIFESDIDYQRVPHAGMRTIIETCTKRKRLARYQSHLDLVADLQDVMSARP